MTTAVEEIRRAAQLMREQAQAATPGPWSTRTVPHVVDMGRHPASDPFAVCHSGNSKRANIINAAHIASWHPGVALAVADWLDTQAKDAAYDLANATGNTTNFVEAHYRHALAVARAYLGGES